MRRCPSRPRPRARHAATYRGDLTLDARRIAGVLRAVTASVIAAGIFVAAAPAHGPCGICLSPTSGPPGTEVTTQHGTAYWIIWNGRGLPQDGALRPVYRRGIPTIELVKLAAARDSVSFRVPAVRPGRYPVVIYDGSENGFHYTWDFFRVTAEDESGFHLRIALLAAGATVLLLLAGAYGARRSMSQPSPSRR
jgi:hypothetical protein